MSSGTDYLSALPVELISAIISFQDYQDRERCGFLSKFLCRIYKSTRTQFRLELNASGARPNDGVRVNSFVDRDKLEIVLRVFNHVNETRLEAYLRAFRVFELHLINCNRSILNRLATKGFTSLFIRHMSVQDMPVPGIELDSFNGLSTLAPNLEFLKFGTSTEGALFTGTEPFTNLKTLRFVRYNRTTNVLPVLSSLTKKTPNLTCLIADVGFSEASPNFFVTLPNLQYIELSELDAVPVPISATNALTQLHVGFSDRFIRIEHPQPSPLSNVEIFGFSGYKTGLYRIMQYYGIGINLKTLCINYKIAKPLDKLFNEDLVWKRCFNLECLLADSHHVTVKSLIHVANICTKLRLVSYEYFLEDNGELNTQLLSETGIKDIFLRYRLPDKELQFLLDSGIDVVYDSQRFFYPHRCWAKRGYEFFG